MYNSVLFFFMRILGKHKFHWLRLDGEVAFKALGYNLWVSKVGACYFLPT